MIKFPFTTLQQFNLDWIMQQLHKILDFMPLNGSAGDVLQRTADGAAWMPIAAISLDVHALDTIGDPVALNDELPIYDNSAQGNYKATVSEIMDCAPVQSVCGHTGDVLLIAADVNALPDTTVIPTDTADLTNTAGFVDAAGAAAAAPVQSVNGQTGNVVIGGSGVSSVNGQTGTVVLGKADIGLGNVDNVQQYSASNPPPYPVTSVNGQTGDVIVGGGGGSSPTLLWTNSSPTANFLAQTVSINLISYSFVIIEYAANEYLHMSTALFKVPDMTPPAGYGVHGTLLALAASGSNMYLTFRSVNVATSGIAFTSGTRVDSYNSDNTTDESCCRPMRIWGIE
jgi:hypothetical protein